VLCIACGHETGLPAEQQQFTCEGETMSDWIRAWHVAQVVEAPQNYLIYLRPFCIRGKIGDK